MKPFIWLNHKKGGDETSAMLISLVQKAAIDEEGRWRIPRAKTWVNT